MLLAHMRVYDEEVVERVMNYLEPILGKERKNKLMRLYRLARAGMILDSIVASYLSFKEKRGKPRYIEYEDEVGKVIEINEFADKTEEEVLSELRKELDYSRRNGYALKDMIKGIWLSDWSSNIVPGFVLFLHPRSRDIVRFVKEAIKEVLEAMDVRLPHNFDVLVEDGYELVKELDELLKKILRKYLII